MSESPTVLQLSTMVPPARFGGAEAVVDAFADLLSDNGFRVRNEGLKPRGASGPGTPVPNLYWPWDGRRRNPALRLAWHAVDALTPAAGTAAARIVDDVRPDVLVVHNIRGWGLAPWAVAARRGIPLIQVVHDYGLLCNASTLWHDGGDCGTVCRLRADRARSRWPGGHLVGVSEAVLAEHHRRGFGVADPSTVIPPVLAATDVGARTPRQDGPPVLGYLGRLAPEKGIETLLDALAGTDTRLVVAGEGDEAYSRSLRDRAPAGVQWRGWMAPADFFAEIDVLVVPSLWREPFGLVVVEAARAGVPVLLADQPGLLEAARVSGARHRSVTAGDAAALRDSLGTPVGEYAPGAPLDRDTDIADVVTQVLAAHRGGRR